MSQNKFNSTSIRKINTIAKYQEKKGNFNENGEE